MLCYYALNVHANLIEWIIEGALDVSAKSFDFSGDYITTLDTVNRILDTLNVPADLWL